LTFIIIRGDYTTTCPPLPDGSRRMTGWFQNSRLGVWDGYLVNIDGFVVLYK